MSGVTGFPSILHEWVEAKYVQIVHNKGEIKFWNGSKITLAHCQYEKDVEKYRGAEIGALLIDEGTHFTETIYRFLRGRLRLGALEIPEKYAGQFPRILIGSNPGSIGHAWIKASFIDPAQPMVIVRQSKAEGGMLRQFIPARLDDNPTLLQTDPDYEDRLAGLGNPALIKALRDGDWNIVAGGMFDGEIWSPKHQQVEPFEIPKSWRIDRGFDWGSSKPYAVAYFAESDGTTATMADGSQRTFPRGSIFVISEIYGWNGKPNEGVRSTAAAIAVKVRAHDRSMGRFVHPGPADSAIFTVENGNCMADDMLRAPNFIRWTRADKSPGSRKNGWDAMRKYLENSIKKPNEMPGLYIFTTCVHTIRTIPGLPRDENKDGDIDTDAEDHIADVIRYRVSAKKNTVTVAPLHI
jgi:hypothetical protein